MSGCQRSGPAVGAPDDGVAMSASGHFDQSSPFCLSAEVRFVPKATEILRCRRMTRCAMSRHRAPLLDHLISEGEELRMEFQPERLGGAEVDRESKLAGLHNREITRFLAL
jgi:hypothetical protein